MRRFALCVAMLVIPATAAAQAPDFNGSFSLEGQNGTIVVTLQATGNGAYAGTMSNGQLTWQMQGEIFEGALTGALDTGQGVMAFEAHIAENQLQMIVVEIGPDGVPLVDQGQEFVFTRVQQAAGSQNATSSKPFPGTAGAAAAGDPFVGSFSNGELTLTLQGQGGSYNGQMAIGAEAFPVAARRNGDRVEGTMNAPTGQYGFFVVASGDGVVLSNAGNEYALRRMAAAGQAGQAPGGSAAAATGAQGQVDNSPLAQQWRAHLAGKKVTYTSSYSSNTLGGGGLSTKFVYHLCSDGRFGFGGSDVVSLNSGNTGVQGGGSAGSSQGTWRIITEGQLAGIELRYANGNVETYRLDMANGQTFANGDRVYVTPGEICM